MMEIDIEALSEELTSAANIVTNDGYYELDNDAVAQCLDKALATTRAELAALKAREVGYVQAMDAMGEELAALKERERETLAVLQTAHESEAGLIAKLSARDSALREALGLMRGDPDMSLPGSDHWLWAKKVRELIGEGETA